MLILAKTLENYAAWIGSLKEVKRLPHDNSGESALSSTTCGSLYNGPHKGSNSWGLLKPGSATGERGRTDLAGSKRSDKGAEDGEGVFQVR